jgi:hypothetical protein
VIFSETEDTDIEIAPDRQAAKRKQPGKMNDGSTVDSSVPGLKYAFSSSSLEFRVFFKMDFELGESGSV